LPDKFTSKSRSFDRNSYGEKDRELPKAAKGFFLVQGIAVERSGIGEEGEFEMRQLGLCTKAK
jgi:hypothetical protein